MTFPGASAALKKYFGFDSFRPYQAEIIREVMEGRDTVALLPTGGGKSLCFQLPALLRDGLTLVISPLIALMKDQVDGMVELGIPATFLNSALDPDEQRLRLRGLFAGEYRLLYVAPERLMSDGFMDLAKQWNVSLIAIDEAHCISEWGHDFRPEYRELARMRAAFPGCPVLALTATATERVREDIVRLLALENPKRFVASFNRPNLIYRVVPKTNAQRQLREFLADHKGESGIVYCHSRQSAENTAQALRDAGYSALPYHAGLEREERARNQDLFIRDEVSIIAATIAFGMGIDKPNVRFVVHTDLPKNLESYYQETGRAGRDGLPSECMLLFSAADAAKIYAFIDQKSDAQEQRIARHQLSQMVGFAEGSECRRTALLRYFGESYTRPDDTVTGQCGSCDSCLTPREKFDGTVHAQKLLSCVYRIKQRSGFAVGLHHIVEVLTGADTEKVRKFGHHQLTTYGIGEDVPRAEWMLYARELIQLGYLSQNVERFNIIELTERGFDALKDRTVIMLTKPLRSSRLESSKRRKAAERAGEFEYDEQLYERLRVLRKELADAKRVPAYIVFSDVTLRHMAARKPASAAELLTIPGVGEKKLEAYGESFIRAISERM